MSAVLVDSDPIAVDSPASTGSVETCFVGLDALASPVREFWAG